MCRQPSSIVQGYLPNPSPCTRSGIRCSKLLPLIGPNHGARSIELFTLLPGRSVNWDQLHAFLLWLHLSIALVVVISMEFRVGIIIIRRYLLEPINDSHIALREHCLRIIWLSQAKRWAAICIDMATSIWPGKKGTAWLLRCDISSGSL